MGRSGGIASSIAGTLVVTAVAVIVATPFGIGTAIYLTEYTREGRITRIIRFSAESLAGIPSIVYGLFGFIFFVNKNNYTFALAFHKKVRRDGRVVDCGGLENR